MKNIKIQIIAFALIAAAAVSCSKSEEKTTEITDAEVTETVEETVVRTDGIAPILSGYLDMNNALADDNSEGAAEAGNKLLSGLEDVEMNTIPEDKTDAYLELAALVKEGAEFIIEDKGQIEFQREHLEDLTEDMLDLIDLLGTTQTLYVIHCPMAFDDTGGDWISDSKEVRNPYFGDSMLTCGAVVKEFQP